MQYHNVDLDLDDGKKCCLCLGLEIGFNVIGVFEVLFGILVAIFFVQILAF